MQATIFAACPRVQLSAFEVKTLQIPELCRKVSKTFLSGSSLKRISMLEVLILIFGAIKHSTIKPKNISPSSISHQLPAMKREDLPTSRICYNGYRQFLSQPVSLPPMPLVP